VLATAKGWARRRSCDGQRQQDTTVWRWQERFMVEGVDRLLRDKIQAAWVPKLAEQVAERIVALTLSEPRARPRTARAGR
jgi:hypothetical protein